MPKVQAKHQFHRYIEEIKRDPAKFKEYHYESAERMKRRRSELSKLAKNNNKVLKEKREKDRIRQKKLREEKKNYSKEKENFGPYICKQTFVKAVKKAENALPEGLATNLLLNRSSMKFRVAIFELLLITNAM